jgi:hypothetical protein
VALSPILFNYNLIEDLIGICDPKNAKRFGFKNTGEHLKRRIYCISKRNHSEKTIFLDGLQSRLSNADFYFHLKFQVYS